MGLWAKIMGLVGLSLIASFAKAAEVDYCVDTTTELIAAVQDFNPFVANVTLRIRIVQGNYVVGNQLGGAYGSYPNNGGIRLLGGYTAGCAARVINPFNTTIDANYQAQAGIYLSSVGDFPIDIEGISFVHFLNTALTLATTTGYATEASVYVRRCRFINNTGKAIINMEAPIMKFVDNLVVENTLVQEPGNVLPPAAVLIDVIGYIDGGGAISNNTIANNSGGRGLYIRGGLLSSARVTEVINNVVWGNQAPDISLSDLDTSNVALLFSYNNYGSIVGYAPSIDNTTSNPQFIGDGNYALQANSPAINSGAPAQFYGFPAKDITGINRIVDTFIDRGAYESPIDNRTQYVVTTTGDNGNNSTPIMGSLRAAIKAANAANTPYTISFNISGGCGQLIGLASPMLDITGDVNLDGRTQPGWAANSDYDHFDATLCLAVNGTSSTAYALRVPASANQARLTVQGLMFAGFTDAAIRIENGSNHRISGNQFGAVPFTTNNHDAIRVTGAAGKTTIGGFDDPSTVNLIAGSTNVGIYLDNALGTNVVGNNLMGYQTDGLSSGSNANAVFVFNSPNNSILYNRIGYSDQTAITLGGSSTSGSSVQNNQLGLTNSAGNVGSGIAITFGAHDNTVGAPQTSVFGGNVIANSGGPGVWITSSAGNNNRVLSNSMLGNGGVDLDLATAGPSANQASNPSIGPNRLQNYPVLNSATRLYGAQFGERISGSLHSAPASNYRIEIYTGNACDSSAPGRGEATTARGFFNVMTDLTGDAVFNIERPTLFTGGFFQAFSLTATDANGNTSEIGNCVVETALFLGDNVFTNSFE